MSKSKTILVSFGIASIIAGGAFLYYRFKKNIVPSGYDIENASQRFKTIYGKLKVIIDTDEATLGDERKQLHIPDDEINLDDDERFLINIEKINHTGHATLRYRSVVITIYYAHQNPTQFKDTDSVLLINEMTECFHRELQKALSTVLPATYRRAIKRPLEFFLIP
jgi:hypothetical protein